VSLSTAGDASRRETFRGKYSFTEAWFGNDFPAWERALTPYRGRPGLRYLEVGVFEGGSVLWMLENVLTDPGSRATVIDPLEGDLKSRFLSNLEKSGEERKVDVIVGFSQIELRKLPLAAYDVVYIDGSHTADDVLEDAVLAWRLVKPGGLLIFDDYEWAGWRTPEPPARTPRPALTAFYTLYGRHFDAVHVGYRLILRRREPGP
jgi:predicted O-methyltransferase YrrM